MRYPKTALARLNDLLCKGSTEKTLRKFWDKYGTCIGDDMDRYIKFQVDIGKVQIEKIGKIKIEKRGCLKVYVKIKKTR